MTISIITPTYSRPKELQRAIESVLRQDYTDWEMLIVNDDPNKSVSSLIESFSDKRIKLVQNEKNLGANASRNKALDLISTKSARVIFLDDDDWLAPDALTIMVKLISEKPNEKWLLTNRISIDNKYRTYAPTDDTLYKYAQDYLIGKRIKGDATHFIDTKLAKSTKFPTEIKNGEEWLYFFDIGNSSSIWYRNMDTTLSEGYSINGLNFRSRNFKKQILTLKDILNEGKKRNLLHKPYFLIFIAIRLIRSFVK